MTDLLAANAAAGPTPTPLDCRVCHYVPAAQVTFRGHRGFVIFIQFLSERGPFCRDCGLTMFRDLTSETLIAGWWSVFSFFIAPVVLLLNLVAYRKIAKLAAPAAASPLAAPNLRPLDPVKPVFARAKSWIGLAIITCLVGFGIAYTPGPGSDGSKDDCVRLLGSPRPTGAKLVSCEEEHDARVIAVVTGWSDCPNGTEGYVELGPRFYCLVEETWNP